MLAEQRRSKIQDLLLQKSSVTIADLSALFGTSAMTIRRDLDELAARGVCQRIHGGAMSLRMGENRSAAYPSFRLREQVQAREKRGIAQAARALIQAGDTIALDSGTTMALLAEAVRVAEGVTVISNSFQVLDRLRNAPGVVAISPGGILTIEDLGAGEMCFAGPMTVSALRTFRPWRSFVSASGVVPGEGIFNAGLFQAEIKRTLIEIAGEAILVADSSKFGRANGVLVAPLTRFRTIITDTAAPQDVVAGLRGSGMQVILAEPLGDWEQEPGARVPAIPPAGSWSEDA